jgi:kynureninase
MEPQYRPDAGVGRFLCGTQGIVSQALVECGLEIFERTDMAAVRAKSLAQTDFLARLLEETGLTAPPYAFAIGSPRQPERRGGHLAVEHAAADRVAKALKARGVIPDFRAPNAIRLAPTPLYTTYVELWQTVQHLREIIDRGEQLRMAEGRNLVA